MKGFTERYLLDTNIVLVSLEAPERLTPRTRKLLQHEDLYVSVLAHWEVVIKTMFCSSIPPTGSVTFTRQLPVSKFFLFSGRWFRDLTSSSDYRTTER